MGQNGQNSDVKKILLLNVCTNHADFLINARGHRRLTLIKNSGP